MKKFINILLSCIFAFALIGCGGEESEGDKTKRAKDDRNATIITTVQSVVKKNLKCPKTAEFPWDSGEYNIKETNSENEDMTIYYVASYVDAENSFGAKVRSNFTVKMECADDLSKYKVLDIKIE